MSKCCCNNNNDVKFFQRPNAGICEQCHPAENKMSPLEAVAMCPPIGEPRLLTMMAPAVFDEIGLNLCRTVCLNELEDVCRCNSNDYTDILFDGISKEDLAEADKIQLQVVDINFNFNNDDCERYSEIKSAKGNPNLSRITLKDIDVTLAVECISECCKVTKTGMMTIRYLGDEDSCGHDSCTNPSAVTFDLYTPYGVGYKVEDPDGCCKLIKNINYMGFIGEDKDARCYGREAATFNMNNTIQQGISAQALAKVIASNEDCFAIGLTLYIKAIYFVQYKFKHEGLTIPPKLSPMDEDNNNSCLDFVCGDLLEASIQPLEVGKNAKTLGCNNNNDDNNCCNNNNNNFGSKFGCKN